MKIERLYMVKVEIGKYPKEQPRVERHHQAETEGENAKLRLAPKPSQVGVRLLMLLMVVVVQMK